MGLASAMREKLDPDYKSRKAMEAIEKYQGSKTSSRVDHRAAKKMGENVAITVGLESNPTASLRIIPIKNANTKKFATKSLASFYNSTDNEGGEDSMANIYRGGNNRNKGGALLGETMKSSLIPMIGAKSGTKAAVGGTGKSALSNLKARFGGGLTSGSTEDNSNNPYFTTDANGNFTVKKEEIKKINLSNENRSVSLEEDWALNLLREAGDPDFDKGVTETERNHFRKLASSLEKRDLEGIRDIFTWFADHFGDFRRRLPKTATIMFAVIGKYSKSIVKTAAINTGVPGEILDKVKILEAAYKGIMASTSSESNIPDSVVDSMEDCFNRYKELDVQGLYTMLAKAHNVVAASEVDVFARGVMGGLKIHIADVLNAIKIYVANTSKTNSNSRLSRLRGRNTNLQNTTNTLSLPSTSDYIETDLNKAIQGNKGTGIGTGWKSMGETLTSGVGGGLISGGISGRSRRSALITNDDLPSSRRYDDDYDDDRSYRRDDRRYDDDRNEGIAYEPFSGGRGSSGRIGLGRDEGGYHRGNLERVNRTTLDTYNEKKNEKVMGIR